MTRRTKLYRSILFCFITISGETQQPRNGLQTSPEISRLVSIDAKHGEVMLVHVRVIDGTGSPALLDQTLLIRNGLIAAIHPTLPGEISNGERVIDLSGRTVLPGLVGMHDHLFYIARPGDDSEHHTGIPALLPQMSFTAPRLYLANGVTTIRTTGSMEPYADLNLRDRIESGEWLGPHMDVTGPYLQGSDNPFLQMHTVHGPAEMKTMIDYWADQGVTSFKAYTHLTRSELRAAIDESHRRGLKITGHLCSVTYPEAAEMGIDNLEHGFFVNTQLDPGKQPDKCPSTGGGPTLRAMDPDGDAAKTLIALLVSRHVAITSTLPVFESDGISNPPLQQRWLDVMTPQAQTTYLYERNADTTSDRAASLRHYAAFKRGEELERRFVAAGGLLLAGPDPTGDGHIIPGFADQREIELLVDSGFTPIEAIRIGTLNGAIYLGRDKQIGSIAIGKNADLMVVRGDPSNTIQDIENVETVFQDGLGFDSAKMLATVRGLYGLY